MSKVALVTGSSRGIGKAIALQLAKDGYDVIINYCGNEAKALDVAKEIEEMGQKAYIIQGNIANKDDVNHMVSFVLEHYDTIDVLVNNAGITKDALLIRMSEDDFDQVVDTNLKGCFYMIKAVSKIMMKKRSGVIINMASVIGLIGNTGQANYAASKAGVIGLTKSVAKELAKRHIRCNAIAPGFIQTDMTDCLSDKTKEAILNQIPMNTLGEVEDIAHLVSFLVSDQAKYITGQVINVDGGMVM